AIDSVSDHLLTILRESIANMSAEIVRVGILINTVTFEDDTNWYFDGKYGPPLKSTGQMFKPGDIGNSTQVAARAHVCLTFRLAESCERISLLHRRVALQAAPHAPARRAVAGLCRRTEAATRAADAHRTRPQT